MAATHSDGERHNSRTKWILAGFLAVAGFFLFTEHRAHLFGILPYLLLLACPLMHVFMHSGHGGQGVSENGHHHRPNSRVNSNET